MTDGPPDDRPRGILAPVDRAFLKGEKEYEHRQSRYNRRQEIRERTRNAIIDFTLLFEYMDKKDREKVFTPPDADGERDDFMEGLHNMFAFVYSETLNATTILPFENYLDTGIRRATWKLAGNEMYDVEVEFEVKRKLRGEINWSELEEKVANGEWDRLTETEMRAFLREYSNSEDFDPSEPRKQWHSKIERAREANREAFHQYADAARSNQVRPDPEPGRESGEDSDEE